MPPNRGEYTIDTDFSLWALFFSAFISSTLAPGGSEILLAYMAVQDNAPLISLLFIASVGNTLGALTTFALGVLVSTKYPMKERLSISHRRGVGLLEKWGGAILVLSWLPVIGDALCFAAGWLRFSFLLSFVAITLGKILRYTVIIYLAVYIVG